MERIVNFLLASYLFSALIIPSYLFAAAGGIKVQATTSSPSSLEAEKRRLAEEKERLKQERERLEQERAVLEERKELGAEGVRVEVEAFVIPSLGYRMVYIQPGAFMMGSPSSEEGRDSDETRHMVTITGGFYLGATEVTQGQWRAIMGNNPSHFKKSGDNCPVESVSWEDCQEFIRKLNQKEGTNKYRLPTEAEWEYACRAGADTPFFFGECLSTEQANYYGKYSYFGCAGGEYWKKILPVGIFPPNAWGLYDMHGNVCEWCADWYAEYPASSVTDPQGSSSCSLRVDRGGSWRSPGRRCRSAYRDRNSPLNRIYSLGFRLAGTP